MSKRFVQIILLTLVVAHACAQMNIECVGKATQVINGNEDTLFIFQKGIDIKSRIGVVDWYRTDGTLERSNSADCSPDDGGYYIVKNGTKYDPFYVFQCPETDSMYFTIEPACGNTVLHMNCNTAPFEYIRPDGSSGSYARMCSIEYNVLSWNGETWEDSLVQENARMAKSLYLPALYGPTPVTVCVDASLRDTLELPAVCVTDTLYEDSVVAVTFQMESLATVREKDPAGSNELNRPTDQKCITASTSDDYSGALEVAFYSNPTPAVRFFKWSIYKASELIATRNDQDIRYSFAEPGNYRVICAVNNSLCAADSTEMKVNISESYLRVPNVFTPDGNGKNDEFRVAYRSLREFHCWVYNRWGKLVYEWTDPSKGWDGTINGRPAAEGAYFYVIRAMGTDAPKEAGYMSKISYNRKKNMNDESVIGIYQLSGDINLLRRKK